MKIETICLLYSSIENYSALARRTAALRTAIIQDPNIIILDNQAENVEQADLAIVILDESSRLLAKKIQCRLVSGKPILIFIHEDLIYPHCLLHYLREVLHGIRNVEVKEYRNYSEVMNVVNGWLDNHFKEPPVVV